MERNSGFAFHVHHDVLMEWCSDYEERVEYIRGNKPEKEIPTRLRLFQLIPTDSIPPDLLQARDAYNQARDAFDQAQAAYVKAGDAYEQELKALHANLCPDCPWDGHTIFPKKDESPYHESNIPKIPRGRE